MHAHARTHAARTHTRARARMHTDTHAHAYTHSCKKRTHARTHARAHARTHIYPIHQRINAPKACTHACTFAHLHMRTDMPTPTEIDGAVGPCGSDFIMNKMRFVVAGMSCNAKTQSVSSHPPERCPHALTSCIWPGRSLMYMAWRVANVHGLAGR